MRLAIVCSTSSSAVFELVTTFRDALLPNELRMNGYSYFGGQAPVLSAHEAHYGMATASLLEHLQSIEITRFDSVLILTDGTIPNLSIDLSHIFAIGCFTAPAAGPNLRNIMTSVLAKCIKYFKHIRDRFQDGKYCTPLRLPLRNFISAELREIRALCGNLLTDQGFSRSLDLRLGQLRTRQQPKKVSSRPETYFVDDNEKYFRLGREIHARAETSCPPHAHTCVYANIFRFGCAIDGSKHFNVSLETGKMDGMYPDCHDVNRSGLGASHLNMFSNDYF